MHYFFCNQNLNKGDLKRLTNWLTFSYGIPFTTQLNEELKEISFSYATKAGISISIDDLIVPPIKTTLINNAIRETFRQEKSFADGIITERERFQKNLDLWHTTSEILKDEAVQYFRKVDLVNPIYMMAFSGARGSIAQVRQLVGMRGLMTNSQGDIIEIPITQNFREGLTVTDYIISCYGARKGLIDTALRTANAGYLTRRLVDVAQATIIQKLDCYTLKGITLDALAEGKKVYRSISERLIGRVTLHSITDPGKQICLIKRNQQIDYSLALQLLKYKNVSVRSPLSCLEPDNIDHIIFISYYFMMLFFRWSLLHYLPSK